MSTATESIYGWADGVCIENFNAAAKFACMAKGRIDIAGTTGPQAAADNLFGEVVHLQGQACGGNGGRCAKLRIDAATFGARLCRGKRATAPRLRIGSRVVRFSDRRSGQRPCNFS